MAQHVIEQLQELCGRLREQLMQHRMEVARVQGELATSRATLAGNANERREAVGARPHPAGVTLFVTGLPAAHRPRPAHRAGAARSRCRGPPLRRPLPGLPEITGT